MTDDLHTIADSSTISAFRSDPGTLILRTKDSPLVRVKHKGGPVIAVCDDLMPQLQWIRENFSGELAALGHDPVCGRSYFRVSGTPDTAVSLDNPAILQLAADHVECAGQHFGPWCIEPRWFMAAVNAVNAGTWTPGAAVTRGAQADKPYTIVADHIAVLRIVGQMQKGSSSFGGTSTIGLRRDLRAAIADPDVKGIMLSIDSPGGTAAGTQELADAVFAARQEKPVHARIEDLGASAAYWVASQAGRISANQIAQVGSIGTVAVIQDLSGAAEQEGIKVHVISTGPYKGMGVPGSEITDEHLKHIQEIVDDINVNFLDSVKRGRGQPIGAVRKWADGRVWVGPKAAAAGLIDAVEPFDTSVRKLRSAIRARASAQPRAYRDADITAHRLQHAESSLQDHDRPSRRAAKAADRSR